MDFHSILFCKTEPEPVAPASDLLKDLNIGQVIEGLTAGKRDYRLDQWFLMPLASAEEMEYRHAVFRDCMIPENIAAFQEFAKGMKEVRHFFFEMEQNEYEKAKEECFLEMSLAYCSCLETLKETLKTLSFSSEALTAFKQYLDEYAGSSSFSEMKREAESVWAELSDVEYIIRIDGTEIAVDLPAEKKREKRRENQTDKAGKEQEGASPEEPDYSSEIKQFFSRFHTGKLSAYRFKMEEHRINDLETEILNLVVGLYPETFGKLHAFKERYGDLLSKDILLFDREIQFYLSYLEVAEVLEKKGLMLCLPEISQEMKQMAGRDCFDFSLALNLMYSRKEIVCNDFSLTGKERIMVVTGPNQGGKTTFARMVGLVHYLASLGLPVPGREVRLYPVSHIYTHFERQESQSTLSGKLQEDMIRIRGILNCADGDSLVIINEMFSSTTLQDAVWLGKQVLKQLSERDTFCIYVTFLEELSGFNEKTVSMVSQVGEDGSTRTYKINRQEADGRAYAFSVAEKYRLTYENITERIKRNL